MFFDLIPNVKFRQILVTKRVTSWNDVTLFVTNVLVPIPESIAADDCVKTKAKPKKRMAAQSAAILFLGFMSSYTWR